MSKIPEKYTSAYWMSEFLRRVLRWSIGIAIGLGIVFLAIGLYCANEGSLPSEAPKWMWRVYIYTIQVVVLCCLHNCGCNCIGEAFHRGKKLGVAETNKNIRNDASEEEFYAELT